ncbi:hypothetical protein N7509_002590 [Penicillium cosmopolitanum]|uniref:N-acetyltransferase B complex non catalytic subunit n=1 Tax=Penicillium cosmopolitanum TaxID=1131564 RepID=A0A9W9W926_9EURO|nr:uncharacterized protein N7509_002590 [Penicillium cosmopolitanum]KAJ5408707.1 hypothetical protein N7509_002590 [Penicillium cosmopolitanum]
MVPANDQVFSRRNHQIQDAIDGQNLKQALQLIEKRMKKGEDTRFLKAWKAQILLRHADETHRQRGTTETLELCNAEPAITEIETLEILFESLQRLEGYRDVRNSLRERAAKASPRDLNLQTKWFNFAYENSDWKSAQKWWISRQAAMSLQKNFPKNRAYYFWAIFLTHMVAVDDESSEAEKKLFGTLSYRMISKAGADVPVEPTDLLSQPRAIQKPEELRLLIEILTSQGRHEEALQILDSENLGIHSRIVRGDSTFIGLKMASFASAGNMWDEAFTFVQSLLTVPSEDERGRKQLLELDDWNLWNLLYEATSNSTRPGIVKEALKLVDQFLEFAPKSRNACLVRVDIVNCGLEKSGEDGLAVCRHFIDNHIHKLYAFQDVRKLVGQDREGMEKMLKYIRDNKEGGKTLVPEINALKLEYCLCISAPENASKKTIEEFVARCMKLYDSSRQTKTESTDNNSATIESQPRDDLCLLAAMAILQSESTEQNQARVPETALIRASGILEHLIQSSPHNYPAQLFLLRIYSLLGAGSMALSMFSKMSIKHMQYESVAHNFFTRLASIHPHSAPPIEGAEYKDFDPQSALVAGLKFYRGAEISTSRYRTSGLNQGAYVHTKELVELGRRLSKSICRRMYALDVRRAQRLVGGDSTVMWDKIARDTSPAADQRDSSVYMNCEFPGKPDFEERLRVGPKPMTNWLAAAQVTDQLFSVLKGVAVQRPLTPEMDLTAASTPSDTAADQTPIEKEIALINWELLKVATFMAGSKATSSEEADNALGKLEDWLNLKKSDLTLDEKKLVLLGDICISVFTILESLKAASQLTSLASRKVSKTVKLPKERVERLSALVPEVFELIRANTRSLKSHILAPGLLGLLVDSILYGNESGKYDQELQDTLDKGLDMSSLEISCHTLMESWSSALEGVMAVKL